MKKFIYFVSIALLAFGINACEPQREKEPEKTVLEGLSFQEEKLELNVGEVRTLEVVVTPSDAEDFVLQWESSDETVASVSDAGEVTALSAGTADITVSSGEVSANCTVIVKKIREQVEINIEVKALSASDAELTVSAVSGQIMPDDNLKLTITNTFTGEDIQTIENTVSAEGDVVETLEGLIPAHVVYGIEALLTTSDGQSVTATSEYEHVWDEEGIVYDCEGNKYTTVVVEGQEWIVENLHVGMLNDGTPVERLDATDAWLAATESPAWCFYNNDEANGDKYGYLYNYPSVSSGKLCPVGWRTPTHEDWQNLGVAVGGTLYSDEWGDYFSMIGIHLKATEGWTDGKNGRDTYGLSFLPGGCRNAQDGTFNLEGSTAYMWSSTPVENSEYGEINVWYITNWNLSNIRVVGTGGFSVRCVRDVQ